MTNIIKSFKNLMFSEVPKYPEDGRVYGSDMHMLRNNPELVLLLSGVTEKAVREVWLAQGFPEDLYFCDLCVGGHSRLLVGRQPSRGPALEALYKAQTPTKVGRAPLVKWATMQIGDSVVLQNTTAPSIYRSIRNFKLANEVVPYEFKVQKIGKKQYRAYRAA